MEEFLGMARTIGGFCLRLIQSLSSVFILCIVNDFSISIVFKCFAIAVGVQLLWSILTAAIDISGILLRGDLRNRVITWKLIVGDLLVHLLLQMASCAAGGLLFEVGNDYKLYAEARCSNFGLSTVVMAGVTSFFFCIPFIQNFRFLVDRLGIC